MNFAKLLRQARAVEAEGVNVNDLRAAINANPDVKALAQKIGEDDSIPEAVQTQFLVQMAQKWKQDPNVFSGLQAELTADPSLNDKVVTGIKTNPAATINGISQYNGTNLAAVMAGGATQAAPNTPQAPQNAPAAPAPSGSTTTAAGVPVAPPSTAPASPAGAVSGASTTPPADPLDEIINRTDDQIRKDATPDNIKVIAALIADKANSSFGVSKATTDGFKKKIEDDKSMVNGKPLAEAIAQNMQKNPDFIRQMARLAKDSGTMSEPFKSRAQQEMNKLMANPELLASDKYVKEKQQQLAMAEQLKTMGMSGFMQNFLGEAMGPLRSGMSEMGNLFAGFSGPNKVISMASGGGMFPTLLINLDAFEDNKNAAMAWNRYSPLEMTAFAPAGPEGKHGKFFHEVTKKGPDGKDLKGPDGKELKEVVPNGQITVKTADGKEMKVIPSVGTLVAKQEPGGYDSNGKYIPGNYRVPMVTDINEHGVSSKIQLAVLSPAEFEKYKKQADAAAQKNGGSIKELEVEEYTVADARRAGQTGPQVVSVNPQTGNAGPAVQVAAAPSFSISMDPNILNPNAPHPQRV